MNRREALKLMMAGIVGALVSCTKKPESEVLTPTNTPAPTAKNVTSATAEPTATETTQPTVTETMSEQIAQEENSTAKVLMTTDISAEGLLKIYEALDRKAQGNVAVKISSGEPGGHHYLSPTLIEPLVKEVNGTIVECNTAYGGGRANTSAHEQVMVDHGFTAIAPTDIMDADGTLDLPIEGGTHLSAAVVGSHFANYDFTVNLAHFKGHAMAGFGGVIKNMAIGISSKEGKCLIHSAGASRISIWGGGQNDFLESMAEATKGMIDYVGENILYINVMNNLSVDCDCDRRPADPTMADIGILASLDPVAVDQACIDLVYAAPDGADLIHRIESRNGLHTLAHAESLGIGSRQYELVSID